MSQARTGAWWRQAHNDLALADLASSPCNAPFEYDR